MLSRRTALRALAASVGVPLAAARGAAAGAGAPVDGASVVSAGARGGAAGGGGSGEGTSTAPPRDAGPDPSAAQGASGAAPLAAEPLYRISLAQWSLHRTLRSGALEAMDFPVAARREYALDAIEYVNTFMMADAPRDTAPRDAAWRSELKRRCEDHGVRSLLVMCDGLGMLGHEEDARRAEVVERHRPWVEFAAGLGCHAIRVNAASRGSWAEQRDRAAAGLRALCEFADGHGIDVIVENHGGLSSNGRWLAETIRAVAHPRAGTLPDFGNFSLGDGTTYDRYVGVAELMPYARAVSAKSHDFDDAGNEIHTDYRRMLGIVLDAGYRGWIGIEYEGSRLEEPAGIRATKALLERVRDEQTQQRRDRSASTSRSSP